MSDVAFRTFSPEEHHTWRLLFERQTPKRVEQIVDAFSDGLDYLKIGPDRIPDLSQVNDLLYEKTRFKGIPVHGLEDGAHFFSMLARRQFPVGNFIRDPKDLAYTPAPDVFHDLYGHLPFFTSPDYADFCQDFGQRACRYVGDPKILRQFERLFWFTIEFALIKTPKGNRIFGAGIASSFSECSYALSGEPEVLPFHVETIRNQEFRIDELQRRVFILENEKQLYGCLNEFELKLA